MRLALLALFGSVVVLCQQPVAPLAEQAAGSQELGRYAVSSLLESGYRFAEVGGSRALYRAGPNYGDGVRLFNARFRATSLDRTSRIDRITLRSSGGPGEPYQSHALRVEADGLFRYDMQARSVEYHNRLPALWDGEHGLRTSRNLQSHDVTLLPGRPLQVLLGWDRNRRSGPGFSSAAAAPADGVFDDRYFLRFRHDIRQTSSVYRAGVTARFAGLALTLVRAVDFYREEAAYEDGSGLSSMAPNVQPIDRLDRSHPHHGRMPVTSLAIRTRGNRRLGFNARLVYTGGYRSSRLLEGVSASSPTVGASYRELFVVGDAGRRQASGEVTATWLATPRLTLTNVTSFHNTRIDGQASVVEMTFFRDEFLRVDHLAVRRLSNATEARFQPVRQVAVFGAYRVSDRRARASDAVRYPEFEFGRDLKGQDNSLRSGAAGVRWLPARGLRASVDLEVGRADRPLAATSERRFQNQSARLRWTHGPLSAGGFFLRRVNDNPTDLVYFSSMSRSHGLQASWASRESGTVVDGSYTVLNMRVSSAILNLFEVSYPPQRSQAAYAANIHIVTAGLSFELAKRVRFVGRYSLTKDTAGTIGGFSLDGQRVTTGLPVSYHSPQALLTLRIAQRVAWNVGWQYYGYAERFSGTRGYRAHIGFSSLTVSL